MRRHSLNFCAWKGRKAAAADLRLINGAATADPAAAELDAFEEKWAGEYTSIHCPAVHVYMHERGFEKGGRNVREWFAARNQFAIMFNECFNA